MYPYFLILFGAFIRWSISGFSKDFNKILDDDYLNFVVSIISIVIIFVIIGLFYNWL